MMVTPEQVKGLRERTGAGIMDCKKALIETNGDLEKAVVILREKGLAKAAKKMGRTASEGIIDSYIHGNGRIGVLVEVNCETDFVAKNEEFKNLVKDIAMQIAASNPKYVSRDDVSQSVIEKEREILRAQAINEGKPEHIAEKIVDGRIEKYYEENCLLEQPYIRDPERKVSQLIMEKIAIIGENITVSRFTRYERGEAVDTASTDE
jgi:elongation factor Ts